MRKICGAIEGIDNPPIARFALLAAALFRHNRMVGEITAQSADNRLLRAAVGLRDQIHFSLVADLGGTVELRQQYGPGFHCRLYRQFQELIDHSPEGVLLCDPAAIVALAIAHFIIALNPNLDGTITPLRRLRLRVIPQAILRAQLAVNAIKYGVELRKLVRV